MTGVLNVGEWLRLAAVLAAGVGAVVACAGLAARRIRSGPRRRMIWQVTVLAVLLLVALEGTGLGPGIVRYARTFGLRNAPSADTRPAGRGPEAVAGVQPWARWATGPAGTRPDGSAMRSPPHEPLRGEARTVVDPHAADTRFPAWVPALLWGLGAAVVAARVLVARFLLVWVGLRRKERRDGPLVDRVRALRGRLGLGRRVRVVESPALAVPMAFGVVRPTVALPKDFCDDLGVKGQDAVLAHELAHLAGRDPVWLLLADVATVLLWWHPLVWLARRRLAEACEAAADEASLLVDDGPRQLAACLVRWGRRVRPQRAAAILGIDGEYRSGLGRRLARLVTLEPRPDRSAVRWGWRLVRTAGPVGLVLVAMLATGWARPDPAAKGEEPMEILRSAWTTSMVGMAVLAVVAGGTDLALAAGEGGQREQVRRGEGERREEGDRERERRAEGDRERERRAEGERERERRAEGERERGMEEAGRRTMHRLESRRVDLEFENISLRDAVAFLDKQVEGVRIALTDGLPERHVSLKATNITVWHALREIAGRGISLRVLPERVLLVREGREGDRPHEGDRESREQREGDRRREGERERERREEGERPHRPSERDMDVGRSLKRLSGLRYLRSVVERYGKREQVELLEQLIHEEEGRYERMLRASAEGERREGDRDRHEVERREAERRREGDRERHEAERREVERREGDRERHEAERREVERREGDRERHEAERREVERREGDRERHEAERREAERRRDREREG